MSNLLKVRPDVIILRAFFTVKKTTVRILVQRILLRAWLYLISPTPRILEVRILEQRGTGPELFKDFRWERMRSNIALLKGPKAGGMWFGTRACTRQGMFQPAARRRWGERGILQTRKITLGKHPSKKPVYRISGSFSEPKI